MQRLLSRDPVPQALRGGVIALGNFDGFHLGHQAVVGRAVALARQRGVPAIVATFDPHPQRFFRPETPPFRLTTLDQRQRLFAAAGADAMLVLQFDADLAGMDADAFVDALLVGRLAVSGVVTGADFIYGRGRSGNGMTLHASSLRHGFSYDVVDPVECDGAVVSSSRIRDALRAGDCAAASRLLSRPFTVEGAVQHGDKLGRTIGFPTANIAMGSYLRPRYGIYAVRGLLPGGQRVDGAANIGVRPSFDPPRELLEPHFFGFSGDLYGQVIAVEFHAFLRPEAKFAGLDALTAQIAADCEAARAILAP